MISKIIINHDKLIDKLFFKEEKYYIKNVSKYNINKNKKYNNVKQYIQNRYLDSSSDRETIFIIILKINHYVQYVVRNYNFMDVKMFYF